jgi:extracellular factor (EF) 3-hydroxypalmitic acid methyl ester biosynthesis protein
MLDRPFYDQILHLIGLDQVPAGMAMLAGGLHAVRQHSAQWPQAQARLREHPLFETLQLCPMNTHSVSRPRGYAGDAGLIDMLYDRKPPGAPSELGGKLFNVAIGFSASEAVRQRRAHAETVLAAALQQGKRICVLACGHFREADAWRGHDVSRVTLVDQDPLSLDVVRDAHGASPTIVEANVFRFLRRARSEGQHYDLIYTLGLTDYLDDRAMHLLHRLMKECVAPDGTILLANFLTSHVSAAWMEAVMDWHLICRTEAELANFARTAGLKPRTWCDATSSVAWCEMQLDATFVPDGSAR